MTCPFYVCDGRPSCTLGEPDGRHCGPRQYPASACNLDEIGRGEAWRAGLAETMDAARYDGALGNLRRILTAINAVCAAGWSP